MAEQTDFDEEWELLATYGVCDGIGGRAYRRVLDQWYAAGCPEGIDEFITERARQTSAV